MQENEEVKIIRIDADLYRSLREYCDSMGLRFKDFVEDALENATYLEEQRDMLVKSQKAMKQIKNEREKAFMRGFQQGVCIAFHAVQGKLGINWHDKTLKEAEKNQPFKCVDGPQIGLFEDQIYKVS